MFRVANASDSVSIDPNALIIPLEMITRVNHCLASVNKGSCTAPSPRGGGGGGGTKTLFIRVGFGWRSKYLQCRNWFPFHVTTEGTLHLFSYIFLFEKRLKC